MESLKPIKRSPVRIYLGKKYYRSKRYLDWIFGDKKFSVKKEDRPLKQLVFTHQTLLLRELKDVDMWLQHNKVKNLKIATKKLNKVIIRPGETFSYWRLLGNTTKSKGYVDGMILHYGKVTTGVGGGLCQLSNLIYWMTLHTPLTITERYRHSYDVFPDSKRSQPFGSGATCAYNYLDLQIKNETNNTYQLVVYLSDTHLVGEWRSESQPIQTYEVYEREHLITREYWGGYVRHNTIHRKVFNKEKIQIDDEFVTENHAIMMYEPLLEQQTEKVN
ncbi:VanW family protein [Mesobacillus selenatarsenatis]|uniref:Vancomycin B-type resistance protein VanW n=1 Tax=Mesobacillus selenatarsenatis (strain DSM 18680 / JCM 14380 / FERM P-15431 / SF-1) TaxID=1321606 RepID=A0A0A8X231_MESS1|nr:VanW family protein [Mesobacillus selenatarsenatis]GAM12196.1 vancomycin B-type resistance protein VanW [Mesobacillus selenatarsenatis SF-1]